MTDNLQTLPTVLNIAEGSQAKDSVHPLAGIQGTAWFQEFDRLDPFVASRNELERLWQSAPSRRAKDWIAGIVDTRTMYAIVTGNPF